MFHLRHIIFQRIAFRKIATKTQKPSKQKSMTSKKNSPPSAVRAPPAAIDVIVVGGGRRDTSTCVLVNTDYSTYLINCPEGAQRILTDIGGSKFSRLEHIFMTTNRWQNGGGLLGMALTLQTAGSKRLAIHGPPNSDKILTLARNFTTARDELRLDIEPCISNETKDYDIMFSDDSVTMGCVPLFPNYQPDAESPKRSRSVSSFGGDTALAFVMKPKPKNRRVDMQKCVKLGLPRGPAIGQLVRGESVTLPDGRVISPNDVLDDPAPARPVIFVECPSESYVKSLSENSVIKAMARNPNSDECAQLVVHMSPVEVFQSKTYQEWLDSFKGSLTDHLVLNENCRHVAHDRIYRMQAQLNQIDGEIFKLLDDQLPENTDISNRSPLDSEEIKAQSEGRVVMGGTGLTYQCRFGQFQAAVKGFPISLCNNEFVAEIGSADSLKSLALYKERVVGLLKSPNERSFPKILFLGTASAIPGKRRNSSGILLLLKKADEVRYLLMDCAEGTSGQFLRYFGKEANEALTRLDLVLLTHRHADHHMGLLGLIYQRQKAFEILKKPYRPLVVASPRYQIANWLRAYSETLDPSVISNLIILLEAECIGDSNFENQHYQSALSDLGIQLIEAVSVRHCRNAVGFHVKTESNFRLVYSGDTMPSENLVNVGKGCNVLIHEATFDDDLSEEAVAKKHSTTSEAVEIGRQMGAEMTLLTHFSQRYETLPHIPDEFLELPPRIKVGIAFDNMLVSREDFALLPHMIPVLKQMFAEKLEALDEIKQKRNLKREREMNKLTSIISENST